MKRTRTYLAAVLAASLAMGAMAGCDSQPSSSESAVEESTAAASAESEETTTDAASADVEQSQDEIIAELKEAAANPFAFTSVTVNETTKSVFTGEAEGDADEISSKTVYKFDASGDKLKTSMVAEIDDITLTYYSDGDDAVFVSDGPVYSGTTEQFDLPHFKGVESYLTDTFGDLRIIVDCADTVTKEQQGDVTVYTVTVNPEKYIAADELLALMAEYGDPLQSATFTFGFDQSGRLVSAEDVTEYAGIIAQRAVTLSDFDSTVIDPMPEADSTYDQMEQDEQKKLDELTAQIEGTETTEGTEGSSDADAAETE